MTTPHILGFVTEERGHFLCGKCMSPIEMVAIVDRRNLRSRIWRECVPHVCPPPFKPIEVYVHPKPSAKR